MKIGFDEDITISVKIQVIVRAILFLGIMFAVLFIPAARWDYWYGWTYFILFVYVYLFNWILIPSGLLKERFKPGPGTKKWDYVFHAFHLPITYAIPLVAALDGGRYHWTGEVRFWAECRFLGEEGPMTLILYISNDQAGRITADTRITFYANKGYHVPQKGGGSTTEFRSIRIPSTDIPLKDVPKTCRDSRRKDILIDGLIEDLSEFQIISVPRIVSVQYQDTEYWWIIERTLIPGNILNQGERDEGHLINPTELERQRKWLVDLMAELHWDTYRLPFATYTEIEVPVAMETAPANNEPLRKKVLAILPSSLEVKDEVVEFVSYCRDFWEKFDEAIETSSRETQ